MTDLSRLPNSHQVPLVDSVVVANADSLHPVPKLTNGASIEEDEQYTIKCICEFQDDDGSTILCEKCDTWQHVECYYEPGKVPGENDNHNCVDCEPRFVDAGRAIERQRAKRMDVDLEARKVKKPPTKSHKKKLKPLEHSPANGINDKNDLASPRNGATASARKQPPTKRPKAAHKHSNSTVVQNPNPKLQPQSRRSASASHTVPSPAKASNHHSSELTYEPYSPEFMRLLDDDSGETIMEANSHSGLPIMRSLADWSSDVDALAEATSGKVHQDVFLRCEQRIDDMTRPLIHKQYKEDATKEYHGRHPRWFYLTVDSDLVANSFVGELRGEIGHMKEYVQNEENRWEYLRHPLPFVFFHPALPIYIDTRKSGTLLRYLRRSCKPNLTMRTFLENDGDYHFCFMANQDIVAGSELTIPWTTDEHVRAFTQRLSGGIKTENSADIDDGYVLDYFGKVFADFGGCACGLPDECSVTNLARHLRMLASEQPTTNGKPKRGRKSANQAANNGNARSNASRSGSEAIRHQEDDDADDAHSTSTSSRSKPQSRDITPANQSANEAKAAAAPGLEVSERDKRKIAAMEKAEHDKNQPAQKKKKRASGNSAAAGTATAASVDDLLLRPRARANANAQKASYNAPKSRYVDAATSRKQSISPTSRSTGFAVPAMSSNGSPTSPVPRTSLQKANYVDAAVQTDPDPEDCLTSTTFARPTLRKPYMSLKKRLLTRAHQEKAAIQNQRQREQATTVQTQEESASPVDDPSPTTTVPIIKDLDGDTVMQNVAAGTEPSEISISPTVEKLRPPDSPLKGGDTAPKEQPSPQQLPPPPLPNSSTWPVSSPTPGFRNTDLRVTLPPNNLTNGAPPTPSSIGQSPIAQTPSTAFTPLLSTNMVQPSPVKKKLSLGDYISRRGSTVQKTETSTASTLGPAKEKEKEGDASSPSAPMQTEATHKPLLSVSAEQAQEKEPGPGNGTPAMDKASDAADAPAVPPALADAMEIDANG